jgi:hypothetical protein
MAKRKKLDPAECQAEIKAAADALEPFAREEMRRRWNGKAFDIEIAGLGYLARRANEGFSVFNKNLNPFVARELIARIPGLEKRMETNALGRGGKHAPRETEVPKLKARIAELEAEVAELEDLIVGAVGVRP